MKSDDQVLITGSTGFLGSIIHIYFQEHERCQIIKLGRRNSNDIIIDLSKEIPIIPQSLSFVLHVAGKAHIVPKNKLEMEEFDRVNYMGTVNLCKGIDRNSIKPKAFVFISSVAVYGKETGDLISEENPLMGTSAYAQSKIKAELFLQSWCKHNNIKLIIFRLPLIAGHNPPGNLGKLIKAIKLGYYFKIGQSQARKSVVWGEDVARIIPRSFDKEGIFNLTDQYHPSLNELETIIANKFKKKLKQLPFVVAKFLASVGELVPFMPFNNHTLKKLTDNLTFDDKKATQILNWEPSRVLDKLNDMKL